MATVVIKFDPTLEQNLLEPIRTELTSHVIAETAHVLSKNPSSVIVEFEAYIPVRPENSPHILFRGETSLANRNLLKSWGQGLLGAWHAAADSQTKSLNLELRIAAKTYVLDSEWTE